jgi:hypothetical protein
MLTITAITIINLATRGFKMFKSKTEITGLIPMITIALAGLVHLLIVPAHYAHAPAHGIFFALAGIVQIAWSVAFRAVLRPSFTAPAWPCREVSLCCGSCPGLAGALWRPRRQLN